MSRSSRSVDGRYDNRRTDDRRVSERRGSRDVQSQRRDTQVQQVSPSEIDNIRDRELSQFRTSRDSSDRDKPLARSRDQDKQLVLVREVSDEENEEENDVDGRPVYVVRRKVTRERVTGDDYPPPSRRQTEDLGRSRRSRDDNQVSRRRQPSPDSESSRDRSRRRRRRPRARSENNSRQSNNRDGQQQRGQQQQNRQQQQQKGEQQQQKGQQKSNNNDDDPGDKPNKEGKLFDPSFDGLISGLAGAALGAMTTRRFYSGGLSHHGTPKEKQPWATVAGAVAGAIAFNAGENALRGFLEEHENHAGHAEGVSTGLEMCGELIDNGVMLK